ncbi:MAG: TrkH family potassium uptake protein [Candidatus Delongbacteria bacterium]|nr:TrkH family potassium uptake protein [Candidatus Delongbacteria bacterium]MBN2835919.1 TrkH family potassium uptake protein [Candidatus Delongbacteria bacterium]
MKQFNLLLVLNVLSSLLVILGISLILPISVSISYNDSGLNGLVVSLVVLISIGVLSYLLTKSGNEKEINLRDGFLVVTLGWFFMALAGALPYYFSGSIPAFTDCFFESMSGFTTTGATILSDIEILPKSILFWRALSHWIGGMGIIVLTIAILPFLGVGGMQLFKAEVPGSTADKLAPRVNQTAKILWLIYVGLTLLEVIFLYFGDMDLFDAVCHSFATMATGGFSTKNSSIAYYNSTYIDYVITVFMILAGSNFALHYKLLRGRFGDFWKDLEFKVYFSVIIVVTILITLSNFFNDIYDTIGESLRYGFFQTASLITTTGFGTADYEKWTHFSQLLLFTLFFLGGSAGSTSGGIKKVRIIVAVKYCLIELKKILHPNAIIPLRLGEKVVSQNIIHSILGFILLYILVFFMFTILVSATGVDLLTSLTSSISCLSNVGPGFGEIGPTENYSFMNPVTKWILALAMMIGRLELNTLFIIITFSFWKK